MCGGAAPVLRDSHNVGVTASQQTPPRFSLVVTAAAGPATPAERPLHY